MGKNQRKTSKEKKAVWRQKIAAIALAALTAAVTMAGMVPLENVMALRENEAAEKEIEINEWNEADENGGGSLEEAPQMSEEPETPETPRMSEESEASETPETPRISETSQAYQLSELSDQLSGQSETSSESSEISQSSEPETSSESESESESTTDEEAFEMEISVDNDGIYDYRTHYGTTAYIYVNLKYADDGSGNDEEKKAETRISVKSLNKEVAEPDNLASSDDDTAWHAGTAGKIPFTIKGTGSTKIAINAFYKDMKIEKAINISVECGGLIDGDYEIYIGEKGSEKEKFSSFQAWADYLAAHDNWINDNLYACLTETGLKYYDSLSLYGIADSPESADVCLISDGMPVKETSIIAKKHIGGKTISSATSNFRLGIDKTAPVIKNFYADDDCYALTSTDKVKYFNEKFTLTGSADDKESGIKTVEYATRAGDGAQWGNIGKSGEASDGTQFILELGNGIYEAVLVRAIDKAGNISELACLKNENGEFIKIAVDDRAPDMDIVMTADNAPYSADGEKWTKGEVKFAIADKNENSAGIYLVEYAYQSIVPAARGEEPKDWHALRADDEGKAYFSIGGDNKNPVRQNGYYYFKATSKCGIKNGAYVKKRILLWQQQVSKMPIIESNADTEKCHNDWYNKESGLPIIDFEYPKYDINAVSGEYAPPIAIHYNLSVEDENKAKTFLAQNKSASIQAKIPPNLEEATGFNGFEAIWDDISKLQINFIDDGIYTLEYWVSDAAQNESEKDVFTYRIDCTPPSDLKLFLAGEEWPLKNGSTLVYEKFYNAGITGHAEAKYGISQKESIKVLMAKQIGEWQDAAPSKDAEQFSIEPDVRCLLYIRAVDSAGNMSEGWSGGVVVDSKAPGGDGAAEMIIEPKGANGHGFFNKDVKVDISIKDAPADSNSSALKRVTENISIDGKMIVSGKEIFSAADQNISEDVLAKSESFKHTETINAQACEGNSVKISVNAADRAGNESAFDRELKIDVTKPKIEIRFDSENALNGRYYRDTRRAEIKIKELNFDPSLVEINVTRDGEKFSPGVSQWQSDKDNHFAYVEFSQDGDYTISVKCRDLADNDADEAKAEPFTIDKTQPRVSIMLENGAENEYFSRAQTAVITVTEHNFDAKDFIINMQPVGTIGAWEHKNDTHTVKVNFLAEGECSLSCEYIDLAGNNISGEDKAGMPLKFVIDTTIPVIEISGVKNNSANSGEVVPVITVLDKNIELLGTRITLKTGRGRTVDISTDISAALAEGGFAYTLRGLDAREDDIYYLEVSAADKADNISEALCRFSLNRRGSAYDVTDAEKVTKRYYNSYNALEDIKIIEMNVDKVEDFELYLSHNADIIYGKKGDRPENTSGNVLPESALYGVNVSGDDDTGYVYTYTLYRENFALEGTYRLGIYSKDRAGNEVNNMLKLNGEEIQFIIDNTVPRVMIDGTSDKEAHDVKSQSVHVSAQDNFKLERAEFMLVNRDGEVLKSWDYFDIAKKEGDTAEIAIGGYDEEVSLIYSAADAAGNESCTLPKEREEKSDFLVNTDKLKQFVNEQLINEQEKMPKRRFMVMLPAGIAGAGAIAGYALFRKKRK